MINIWGFMMRWLQTARLPVLPVALFDFATFVLLQRMLVRFLGGQVLRGENIDQTTIPYQEHVYTYRDYHRRLVATPSN
jgi:hypothetical protein